ncbi:hypothetical protein PL18_09780 [Vibrio renipiscarius]|uniref:Uncharacterized protein n=1 Tax=Vibrio renipiscarius TaxID=1461322 RepID=A0A0C2KAX6_9VIBR|nr:hypothetical protein OJ16_14320 [Vibrio renipiscarius]KII79108.1 hypothetical protein PL18_09780 [Vibrio renipiscarius]
MNNSDNEFWHYGDKWSKSFPLRWPPAKNIPTFVFLTGVLFFLWGSSAITLYEELASIPRTAENRGVDPVTNSIVLSILTYIVWMWRYTVPLSLCRYRKDQYNRPKLSASQQWLVTLIMLLLCFGSFVGLYFVYVPKFYW